MTEPPTSPLPDLACETVGGAAIAANDEFFAPKERLLRPEPAVWDEHRYTERGKWMDGWETRRRREPGHDWCIVRLGVPGVVQHAIVDTAHFRGNHAEACELHGTFLPADAGVEALEAAEWTPLVGRTTLHGDHANRLDVDHEVLVSHVRLVIHPDGGVARLRLHGAAVPDWTGVAGAGQRIDLAAVHHGGRVVDASDRFFSDPVNLLRPGPSRGMHDGWETRRRRGPGNDWVQVALGAAARVEEVVVDTSHFKGNAPGACAVSGRRGGGAWHELVARSPLEPHTVHTLATDAAPDELVDEVRLDIFPDGGVARFRVHGRLDPEALAAAALGRLDVLHRPAAVAELLTCCGSTAWAGRMADRRPFGDVDGLRSAADAIWAELDRDDRLEAFAAHPRIGDDRAERDVGARARRWSSGEQSGVRDSDREALVEVNRAYEERFGWVFLICATGLDSATILDRARQRLDNDPETELEVAAEEQRRITQLRIDKLLGQE